MRVTVWRTALVAAAVLNLNFVLDLFAPHPDPPASGVISDLGAANQAEGVVYRIGDGLSGLLLLACAVVLLVRPVGGDLRRVRVAAGLTAAFGLSTVVAALVPLTCARSVQGSCPPPGAQDLWHDGVSTVGTFAALVAMALLVRVPHRPWLRRVYAACLVIAAGTGVALVVADASGDVSWFGAVQRAQVVAVSAWIAALAWLPDPLSGDAARR